MRKYLNALLRPLGYELRRLRRNACRRSGVRDLARRSPLCEEEQLFDCLDHLRVLPGCVFDVGAHTGAFACKCRAHWPRAMIYCFEPGPGVGPVLRERLGADDAVRIEAMALGSFEHRALLYQHADPATNSLLRWDPAAIRSIPRDAVRPLGAARTSVSTLDSYCGSRGIGSIEFLKIDTQGFDLEVLRGGEGLLGRRAIGAIYVEMLFVPLYEGQAEFHEICAYLHKHQYRLYSFHGGRTSPQKRLLWANGLFIPGDHNGAAAGVP